MRVVVCALAALSVVACASVPPVPQTRPLNARHIDALGSTSVVLAENNNGVMKSWFMQDSSAAAASQGLLGVLVGAAMDGIMNYIPSRRAHRAADELAEVMSAEVITASLVEQFQTQLASGEPGEGVVLSDVRTVQKLTSPDAVDDALEVTASYLLSEDASALQVVVTPTRTPEFPTSPPIRSRLNRQRLS